MKYTNSAQEAGHIVFVHPSLMGGGAERVSLALASYFIAHGFRFTYLLTKSPIIDYDIPEGVEVVSQFASSSVKPLQQIRYIRGFMRDNPQATFISFLPHQNMYTLIASIGLTNKVVVSVRNDPRFDFPGNAVLPKMRDALYRKAVAIVFQTQAQKDLFPRPLQEKGTVILNPISASVPEAYEGSRRKAIVTSGRLEEQKNHGMTIRAFAEFHKSHPDYTLEVFGKGSLKSELIQLADDLGVADSVVFKGFSPDALEDVRTASAFVMSSRFEGLSNSMLEALAMGVPTVCTRCLGGGAEAVIDDGVNGLLVDVDDFAAEARSFDRLVDDLEFAQTISAQARRLRDELSLENIGNSWRRLIS